jgi:hypothetical protein
MDSIVGVATHYGPDGPGSKAGENEIFLTHPNRPRGPPSLLYNEYRVCPLGKEGDTRSNHPPLSRPRSLKSTSIPLPTFGPQWHVPASLYPYITTQWQPHRLHDKKRGGDDNLTFLDHWPPKWQLCKSALTNTSDNSFSGSEHDKPYRTQETDNRQCCGQDMNTRAQRERSPIPCSPFYRVITVIGITHCTCPFFFITWSKWQWRLHTITHSQKTIKLFYSVLSC